MLYQVHYPRAGRKSKTVFLDTNSCKSSELPSPKGKTQFSIQSKPWKPNVEGPIIDSIGHLHDGGVKIDILAGGSPLCRSKPIYSGRSDYVFKDTSMAMHGDKISRDHISSMEGCGPKDIKIPQMTRTQTWLAKGNYDYNKRAANIEGGKPSEIMAIAIILVAVPPGKLRPI